MKILWLLSFFLVSCSSNYLVSNVPGEQAITVQTEAEEKNQLTKPYLLGPNDQITVSVWRNDDLRRTLQIDPSGYIQFPLIGEIKASGLSISRLTNEMTLRLSKYIVDPQVDVVVTRLDNLKVNILGEVRNPGTFDWRSGMSAWEGIAQAGGFNNDADREEVLLIRNEKGKAVVKALDFDSIITGGGNQQDLALRSGDVIYVIPTDIVDVQRFMTRLSGILAPIISVESGIILYPQVKDVLQGKDQNQTIVVPGNS